MAKTDIAKEMRSAGISINNSMVTFRSESIDDYLSDEIQNDEAFELVKLCYTGKCSEDFLEEFVEVFKEKDNTFSDDMINEIRVLSGIILCEVVHMEKWDEVIQRLELYAFMYEFIGCQPACKIVGDTIHKDFDKRRIEIRENISFDVSRLSPLNKSIKFSTDEENEEVYNETVAANLDTVVNKVNELVRQLNNIVKSEKRCDMVIYEESEMLWWLLTGISDDLSDKYKDLEVCQAAVLIGKDLAKRVKVFPGPYPVRAIITKALDFVEENKTCNKFDEYIDSVDDSIINSMFSSENCVDTPMIYALKRKAENGEGNWKQALSKRYTIIKDEFNVVDIAYEMYIECLFVMDTKE